MARMWTAVDGFCHLSRVANLRCRPGWTQVALPSRRQYQTAVDNEPAGPALFAGAWMLARVEPVRRDPQRAPGATPQAASEGFRWAPACRGATPLGTAPSCLSIGLGSAEDLGSISR